MTSGSMKTEIDFLQSIIYIPNSYALHNFLSANAHFNDFSANFLSIRLLQQYLNGIFCLKIGTMAEPRFFGFAAENCEIINGRIKLTQPALKSINGDEVDYLKNIIVPRHVADLSIFFKLQLLNELNGCAGSNNLPQYANILNSSKFYLTSITERTVPDSFDESFKICSLCDFISVLCSKFKNRSIVCHALYESKLLLVNYSTAQLIEKTFADCPMAFKINRNYVAFNILRNNETICPIMVNMRNMGFKRLVDECKLFGTPEFNYEYFEFVLYIKKTFNSVLKILAESKLDQFINQIQLNNDFEILLRFIFASVPKEEAGEFRYFALFYNFKLYNFKIRF
jgi:hypothetical protein